MAFYRPCSAAPKAARSSSLVPVGAKIPPTSTKRREWDSTAATSSTPPGRTDACTGPASTRLRGCCRRERRVGQGKSVTEIREDVNVTELFRRHPSPILLFGGPGPDTQRTRILRRTSATAYPHDAGGSGGAAHRRIDLPACERRRPRSAGAPDAAERPRRRHRRPAYGDGAADAVPQQRAGVDPLRLLLRQQPALLSDPSDAADRALLPSHGRRDQPCRGALRRRPRRSPPGSRPAATRPACSASTSTTTPGTRAGPTSRRDGMAGRRSPATPPTTTTRWSRPAAAGTTATGRPTTPRTCWRGSRRTSSAMRTGRSSPTSPRTLHTPRGPRRRAIEPRTRARG